MWKTANCIEKDKRKSRLKGTGERRVAVMYSS